MIIHVDAELKFGGRSGVEARSPDLHLTSHGLDEPEALQSLQRGILALCEGLQSVGRLEKVLRTKKLKFESDGESIAVEIHTMTRLVHT